MSECVLSNESNEKKTISLDPQSYGLSEFVTDWDRAYSAQLKEIKLFNFDSWRTLTESQRAYFIRSFYHLRGHFHDFLWYMGSHAPDESTKLVVLNNIAEEFGGHRYSHEQLYYDFARSLEVDIAREVATELTYEPYALQFNKGHIKWLVEHDWHCNLAAFAAYEHLDNIDYPVLSSLARRIGTPEDGMLFFTVHEKVTHFDSISDMLIDVWQKFPEKVKFGFDFIAAHQLEMWKNLSRSIFAHG